MAQRGSYGLSPQLDIEQLQVEAQHRWLRPAEICEILRNYQKFQIASEPPTRPPSGSLFLFDRKVLRYFRKDGHNWRKKRDGKTVKEAHEKLKVGSVDVLHCYYAHGEENENFQRRSYWMLEQDLMHIVFVHYLEVKGNRTSVSGVRENEEGARSFQKDSPPSYSYSMNHSAAISGNTDSTSPTSTLTSLCEDADSGEIHRNSSGLHPIPSSLQKEKGSPMNNNAMSSSTYFPSSYPENHEGWSLRPDVNITSTINVDGSTDTGSGIQSQKSLGSWEEILKESMSGSATVSSHAPSSSSQTIPSGVVFEQENMVLSELLGGESVSKQQFSIPVSAQPHWQVSGEDGPWTTDQSLDLDLDLTYEPDIRFLEQIKQNSESRDASGGLTQQYEHLEANEDRNVPVGGEANFAFAAKRLLSDGEDGLKKVDSFSRWISKELGDVVDLQVQSTSGLQWSTDECGNVEESSLGPSISQDQLFSILDFSPKWAYGDSGIKVLIVGTFLKNQQEVAKYNWSCMFGEVEVPTTVLTDGILSCRTPAHVIGRVPFYITCSNRLACSEVREFDFRAGSTKGVDISEIYDNALGEMHLHLQLERLLSSNAAGHPDNSFEGLLEKRKLIDKIIALKDEEEKYRVNLYQHEAKEELLLKLLKEKLYSWLLHKVIEDGKGPCILDDQGQGAIHLAAALGYNWAIKPILSAGVSINFRDVNGWTALHWAAFCGREQTVAVLLSLDAAPGVLSDPSPEYPLGRTPADLASDNGHKGISGFIAECMLTSYLEPLTVNDPKEDSPLEVTEKAVQTISERSPTPLGDGDMPDVLSLKDSLNAVCNATQAAHRIHLMFRIQSFQRKKLETGDYASEFSDEHAIGLVATKNRGTWLSDGLAHGAAIQIQKKFRGWKKRKEFLTIRQRIVKIQAHVRGHQAVVYGGYRSDALNKHTSQQALPQKEDDYDFLKDGRKQTEERLQKALTRVKSMVQYPEARSQYRRLLNVVEGMRENKTHDMVLSNSAEVADGEEDLLDIDSLLDDDTLMSITFD
ncbi:hypothetical protein NL676_015972 [Syzygium grande]|nr:hypothetical protein NL676_015972 [Syzygium grande]